MTGSRVMMAALRFIPWIAAFAVISPAYVLDGFQALPQHPGANELRRH